MAKKINIGTLISGGGTNLQAIIDSCRDSQIDAKILFTGSDNPGVKGLERAQKADIDTFVLQHSLERIFFRICHPYGLSYQIFRSGDVRFLLGKIASRHQFRQGGDRAAKSND